MTHDLVLQVLDKRGCCGFKGPRAVEWLRDQGLLLPTQPNSWAISGKNLEEVIVARLGASEFFIEGMVGTEILERVASNTVKPSGVYPVLREDCAFVISGTNVDEVLAQVCSFNFADLALAANPVIMTLVMDVAVLIVPQESSVGCRYRVWCDPTFARYILDGLEPIVIEYGGVHRETYYE